VRIEDDVHLSADGPVLLTDGCTDLWNWCRPLGGYLHGMKLDIIAQIVQI